MTEEEKARAEAEEVAEERGSEDILVEDIVLSEAVKDVEETVDEDIARYEALSSIKSDVAKELRNFLEECNEIELVVRNYIGNEAFESLISGEITMKDAIALAMKLMSNGETEEDIYEPSPYVQALFEKVMQKLNDCKAFRKMLKRGNILAFKQPKGEPKYLPIPEELLRSEGRKI